jgi:hypothetical protein
MEEDTKCREIRACARVVADDLLLVDDAELRDMLGLEEYRHFLSMDAGTIVEELVTDAAFLCLMNPESLRHRLDLLGLTEDVCTQIEKLFLYKLQTMVAQVEYEPWVRVYVTGSDAQYSSYKPYSLAVPSRVIEALNDRMDLGTSDVEFPPRMVHFKESFNYVGMASRAEAILYFILTSAGLPVSRDVGFSFEWMKCNVELHTEKPCRRHVFVRL